MENLKHTVVAAIAVVMIGSLATVQAASIRSDVAPVEITSESVATQQVWDDNLISVDVKLSAINKNKQNSAAVPANELSRAVIAEKVIDPTVGYVILSDGTLNVRETASTEAEVVGKLNCGDKVTILETLEGWHKITYGDEGKTGYVTTAAITNSEEEAKTALLTSFIYETGTAVVSEGALNIRSGAGKEYEVIDQIDNGDKVVILEKGQEWMKVYFGRNYETGYVSAPSINVSGMVSRDEVKKAKSESIVKSAKSKGYVAISSGAVNVRSSASENGEVMTQLYNKDNVLILSTSSGWTKIAYGSSNSIGYVKSEYIVDSSVSSRSSSSRAKSSSKSGSSSGYVASSAPRSAAASSLGQALVNEAEKYIGTKYVYGGSSPSGFDCSGLVQYACRKVGISVSRSSRSQFHNGVPVSKSDLQPGDLVFFGKNGTVSHVGIYAGNGQMIHSPQTGKTVTYASITTTGRSRSYMGARRVTGQ